MKKLFNKFSFIILFYYWIANVDGQSCDTPAGTDFIFGTIYVNPTSITVDHEGVISSIELTNTVSIASSSVNNMPTYLIATLTPIVDSENSLLSISVTEEFKNFEMNEKVNQIYFSIVFRCTDGERRLNLQQDIIIENRHNPTFLNDNYDVEIPLPLPQGFDLTIFIDISANDNDLLNNAITFTSDSDLVTVGTKSTSGLKTSHAFVKLNQQLIKINGEIEFTIVATDNGVPSKSGSTIIRLIGNDIEYIEAPNFEKSIYYGSITDDGFQMESTIILDPLTYDENVIFEINQNVGDFDMFTITTDQNIITVYFNEPDTDLTDKQYLHFQIGAYKTDYRTAYTTIIINIPMIECELPPIITTEEPIPETTTIITTEEPFPETTTILVCPECPETTLPPVDGTPVFEQIVYFFTIFPNFSGAIGSVTASVAGQIAWIEYSLSGDANLLAKLQINRDTGELMITEPLTQGVYVFTTIAKNPVNDEEATAEIRLTVRSINVCPNDKKTVADTLLIMSLIENVSHNSIMEMEQDDCSFEINAVLPNDKQYFTIDETTKMLKTSMLLDREDPIFADMPRAQLQVHLLLKCPEVKSILTMANVTGFSMPSFNEDFKRFIDFPDGIPFSIDSTYLTIFIEDTNDNPPTFIFPSINNYLIGYPTPDVAERILPSHLIQVRATDIDEGLNAKLKYSLQNDSQYWIDEETGVISPYRNSMANEEIIFLTVSATDMDGHGHSASTTLRIVPLEAKHLTYLTIVNTNNDDIDTILNYLKTETQLELRLLQSAVVPLNEKTKNMDFRSIPLEYAVNPNVKQTESNDRSTIVRLVVYAFVDQRPIVTADMENAIKNLNTYEIDVYPYNDSTGNGGVSTKIEEDFTVFIVVISLLSVLLLILAVTSFFGWWYWIRPYEYKRMGQTSETNLKTDFGVDGDETTPPTTSKYNKKDSVFIHGVPYPEENDDVNRLSYTLSSALENNIQPENEQQRQKSNTIYNYDNTSETSTYSDGGSPSKERKKSIVTFNELVERIDIIETDDTTIQQNINKNIDNKND